MSSSRCKIGGDRQQEIRAPQWLQGSEVPLPKANHSRILVFFLWVKILKLYGWNIESRTPNTKIRSHQLSCSNSRDLYAVACCYETWGCDELSFWAEQRTNGVRYGVVCGRTTGTACHCYFNWQQRTASDSCWTQPTRTRTQILAGSFLMDFVLVFC